MIQPGDSITLVKVVRFNHRAHRPNAGALLRTFVLNEYAVHHTVAAIGVDGEAILRVKVPDAAGVFRGEVVEVPVRPDEFTAGDTDGNQIWMFDNPPWEQPCPSST